MTELIQLIYSSSANQTFRRSELTELLIKARQNNRRCGVTGILLYAEGSFFQVLEGEPETVDRLFASIQRDQRHKHVTAIIREPVSERAFGDWTMGYANITPEEADAIIGVNDFFGKGESLSRLGHGRAKKLLSAFMHGRWRTKLSDTATPVGDEDIAGASDESALSSSPVSGSFSRPAWKWYTFAYQPIIQGSTGQIFSYEALIRGRGRESAEAVLQQVKPEDLHGFDEESRNTAMELAAHLGLAGRLNLNFLPLSIESSGTAISSLLETAGRCRFRPEQIILEILEREIISDIEHFKARINQYRGLGICMAIDDFGAGYAGLNLLAEFQPEFIKLDMQLVRGVDRKGPRQAIVSGILRTCYDLGIDIIAEGVETREEFQWLRNQGIDLFQGWLFAKPAFEALPGTFHLPAEQ